MVSKKILVTGGLGYIGSHTVVELLQKGYDVVIYDNLSNAKETVAERIFEITGKRPLFVKGDLLDKELLEKTVAENKFCAVFHFAGLKAVGESVCNPLLYFENNVVGTINLLQAINGKVENFVFSSSATVYGNTSSFCTETMPMSAVNPYGQTKIIIENMLKDFSAANKDFNAIILRYFNPVGAHKSGLIGEDPNGTPNNLAAFTTQVLVGKQKSLQVFGNDYETTDGTGVRDYIHVLDLASGHIVALEKCKKAGFHVFNLGTGKGTSVLQLLAAFEKTAGKRIPYQITKRRPGDVATLVACSDKAKAELGWNTKYNIDDMCRDAYNFARRQQ